jgi:hypothetical protein
MKPSSRNPSTLYTRPTPRAYYALNNPLASVDPSGLCPGHSKSVSCSSAGGGDDDGTIDGIDEFDFIQIPVYGNGFGEFPDQGNPTFSSPVTSGQFAGSQMVGSLTMLSFGWGYEQIGTGFDFLGDSIPIGGSGSGGEGGAPNNSISSTPQADTPKTSNQCSIYQDGTATGNLLSQICQKFPNGPKSNQMRGCLQSLYTPGSGYFPITIPISPGGTGPFPGGNLNIPGAGAHLACLLETLGAP